MSTENLPTKKEFQDQTDLVKKEQNISRCQAYEVVAKRYGHSYGSIKNKLVETKLPKHLMQEVTWEEIYKEKERRYFANAHPTVEFKPRHRFDNQELIDGIAYNPNLPKGFWTTDNNDRELEELENWWNVAFIVSNENGYFTVYRLDGGAWDRPTRKGTYKNFTEALTKAQELNNIHFFKDNRYKTLSNGAVVNYSGLFISSNGKRTAAPTSKSSFDEEQIKKAQCFVEVMLEKQKTINKRQGTSYTLKHRCEDFIRFYFPRTEAYISNGTFIYALDSLGFEIKEKRDSSSRHGIGQNINTNYKTLKRFNENLELHMFDTKRDLYLNLLESI